MAQLVIAAAGAALGGYLVPGVIAAGITGAQAGWIVGSLVGSAFAPAQKVQGPRLSDLTVSSSAYGTPIPYVQGSPRLAGQIIYASTKREIATTTRQGGKGGGGKQKVTTYTYEVDLLILLTDNLMPNVTRIWSNGKLIWNKSATADAGTIAASDATPAWSRIAFYSGAASQLPDPTYEAAVGMANAPAYRGRGTVFIQSLQLGTGGQIPNLTFEISEQLTVSLGTEYFSSNAAINIQGARVEDDRAIIAWQNAGTDLRGRIMRVNGINASTGISFGNVQHSDLLPITATTFLAAWVETPGTNLKGCVLTTSGSPATTFSPGTEYTLDATAASSGTEPFLGTISATQSLLVSTGTTSGQLRGQVVGIAGTVLTAGAITAFASGVANLVLYDFCMLSPTQGLAIGVASSTLYIVTVSVSGTTVTFGTPYAVPSAGSASSYAVLARTSSGGAVAIYKVGSTELRSFTVSAGGSCGSLTTIMIGNYDHLSLAALNSSVLLLSYNAAGAAPVRAVPINSSGLIAGADMQVSAGDGERSNVIPLSSTQAIVAWRSGSSPFNVTYNTVTVA